MLTTTNFLPPTHELFKYRAINDYTLSFLRTGAVYFSSPREFNDPFDTRFVNRDLGAQHQQFERERRAKGTDWDRLALIMMDTFEREHRTGEVKIRIYCLSEIVDSTLMWSHYADSHRGICVVLEAEQKGETWFLDFARSSFDFAGMALTKVSAKGQIKVINRTLSTEENIVALPVLEVLYSDQMPSLVMYDPLPGGPMRGLTFEFVKHTSWSYERERRIVVRDSFLAENPAHLSCDAIVGVVFGLKVSKFDALRVQAAINDRTGARSVTYSRMVERPDSFGLDRVPITDLDSFIHSL